MDAEPSESQTRELQHRLDVRESRPEDLAAIEQLRKAVREKDEIVRRTYEEMKYFKLELQNREENFNKNFGAQPRVGVELHRDAGRRRVHLQLDRALDVLVRGRARTAPERAELDERPAPRDGGCRLGRSGLLFFGIPRGRLPGAVRRPPFPDHLRGARGILPQTLPAHAL